MTQTERAAILDLLNSPHVTAPTRRALQTRLDARFAREFFNEAEFARLRAAATRLVPHDPAEIDLAGLVDHRLHAGGGDGWRYADAPPDGEAYRRLLRALPQAFEALSPGAQDAALRDVQAAHPRAFEDLLAELTEGFMAHPLTQYRFGYAGFADAPGWPRVGPDELEAREEHYGPR